VIYIREQRAKYAAGQMELPNLPKGHIKSQLHTYQLNTWVDGLQDPWSLAFLSETHAVVTEKRGRLYEIVDGSLVPSDTVFPKSTQKPKRDFSMSCPIPTMRTMAGSILAFSDLQKTPEGKRSASPVSFAANYITAHGLSNRRFIKPARAYPAAGGVHFGGRLAFDRAGYLYFTIGERGTGDNAQNLSVPWQVHRVFDDDVSPMTTPLRKNRRGSHDLEYGHRNPQAWHCIR